MVVRGGKQEVDISNQFNANGSPLAMSRESCFLFSVTFSGAGSNPLPVTPVARLQGGSIGGWSLPIPDTGELTSVVVTLTGLDKPSACYTQTVPTAVGLAAPTITPSWVNQQALNDGGKQSMPEAEVDWAPNPSGWRLGVASWAAIADFKNQLYWNGGANASKLDESLKLSPLPLRGFSPFIGAEFTSDQEFHTPSGNGLIGFEWDPWNWTWQNVALKNDLLRIWPNPELTLDFQPEWKITQTSAKIPKRLGSDDQRFHANLAWSALLGSRLGTCKGADGASDPQGLICANRLPVFSMSTDIWYWPRLQLNGKQLDQHSEVFDSVSLTIPASWNFKWFKLGGLKVSYTRGANSANNFAHSSAFSISGTTSSGTSANGGG